MRCCVQICTYCCCTYHAEPGKCQNVNSLASSARRRFTYSCIYFMHINVLYFVDGWFRSLPCRLRGVANAFTRAYAPRKWICRHRAPESSRYFSYFKISNKFSKFEIIKVRLNFSLLSAGVTSHSFARSVMLLLDFYFSGLIPFHLHWENERKSMRVYLHSPLAWPAGSFHTWLELFHCTLLFRFWRWRVCVCASPTYRLLPVAMGTFY